MQLKNRFSQETKNYYLYRTDCEVCGSNQMLTLHHNASTVSDSPLNAVLICGPCHEKVKYRDKDLMLKNLNFLRNQGYVVTDKDRRFIRDYFKLNI